MRASAILIVAIAVALPLGASADRVDQALKLLAAPVFKARVGACLALGTQKNDAARIVKPLIKALKDRQRAVRAACSLALGKLGAIESAAALSELMTDEDTQVAKVARKARDQVVRAFVKNRGKFNERRFNIHVQGLSTDGEFKDAVMERLLAYENIDVGGNADFDESGDAPLPAVKLDMSGQLQADGQKATLELVLSLRDGGFVITSWKRVLARGKTREELLANMAKVAVGRVLGYLGAKVR